MRSSCSLAFVRIFISLVDITLLNIVPHTYKHTITLLYYIYATKYFTLTSVIHPQHDCLLPLSFWLRAFVSCCFLASRVWVAVWRIQFANFYPDDPFDYASAVGVCTLYPVLRFFYLCAICCCCCFCVPCKFIYVCV